MVPLLKLPRECSPVLRTLAALWLTVGLTGARVALPEEPQVFAITGARIVPVAASPVDKGTILFRQGIIEAVGADVRIPGDARVIDGRGLVVYPGLIDALTGVAMESAPAAARGESERPAEPRRSQEERPRTAPSDPEHPEITPYISAADLVNPGARGIESARSAGFTTALMASQSGHFPGQSALVNLSNGPAGLMILKSPVALHVSLQARGRFGGGNYPGSLMGVTAFVRQTLLDAQHYGRAWEIYEKNPGSVRPAYDRALQALQPVVRGELPVVLPGDNPAAIRRSLKLAEEFKVKLILSGGGEASAIAPVLREKDVPVLLSVDFPRRDREGDPDLKEELEDLRRRVEAPANPAALAKSGVRFGFQSGDSSPSDFLRNVRRAVEAGLDRDVALRALTLTPAEIFGVSDRVGSLERGKAANLTVTTGDLFESQTRIKYVFIDGARFEIPDAEPARAAPPSLTEGRGMAGTWALKVNSPQGPIDVTLNLRQEGAAISGSIHSPHGPAEISEGSAEGSNLSFKVSVRGPEGTPMVVSFTATVQGTRMTGSADVGSHGKMEFTGLRSPEEER